MRRNWLLLIALAGCDSPPPVTEGKAPPETVALVDGSYALIWECVGSCSFGAPIKYEDIAAVDVDTIRFDRTSCRGCELVETHCTVGDCYDCDGVAAGGSVSTEAFSVCPAVGGPQAIVGWTNPGTGVREEQRVRFTPSH